MIGSRLLARLVMNLLLMQDGYPPTIIIRINRQQYYRLSPCLFSTL